MNMAHHRRERLIKWDEELDLQAFSSRLTDRSIYPQAADVVHNVPIYQGDVVLVASQWYNVLLDGPGVFVIKQCEPDSAILDKADAAFTQIILDELKRESVGGDHFGQGGSNDRIWNSFQKHAEVDPAAFVDYYANEILSMASEAWLGPGYQVTAQCNVVKPGGAAQKPHRDYHLGFQSEEIASAYPITHQIASQYLTLQGAVAHTDMPLESGPTLLLPFSQNFKHGYLAYRQPAFVSFFHEHKIQLPLQRGDALFFNPALFHAAGENTTKDFKRAANLLQVSAAWGRPMENVDRTKILKLAYRHLASLSGGRRDAAVRATADGYSFPTNLDKDPPPSNGHCPPTQQSLVLQALKEGWSQERFDSALNIHAEKQKA